MKFNELPIGTQFKSQGHVYLKVAMSAAREIERTIATVFQDDTPVEPVEPTAKPEKNPS